MRVRACNVNDCCVAVRQAAWLKLCGDADPQKAKRENEFALRAIFGTSASSNALHASVSYSAALSEAELLFPELGKGEGIPQGDSICGAARRQVVLGAGEKSLKEVVLVVLCSKVLEEEAGRLGEQPAGQAALAGRGQAAEEQEGAPHGH